MKRQKDIDQNSSARNNHNSIWGLPTSVVSFVIITMTSAIVYRIVTLQVSLQFDFSAFLSLFLALFAVVLSALFYFKTTDTSNLFYDNTHKFTGEVSQILGRIESGFGERLRHIDENYTGLVEKLPFDVSKAREKEKEEKEEVAEKEAQIKKIMDDLAERAKLAVDEKKQLLDKWNQTQHQLDASRYELSEIRKSIDNADLNYDIDDKHQYNTMTKRSINRIFNSLYQGLDVDARAARVLTQAEWQNYASELISREDKVILRSLGYMDSAFNLTLKAFSTIRRSQRPEVDNP